MILGHPWLTEIAYFHRPSATVILGDVGFNISSEFPLKIRLVARLFGIYGRVAPSRTYRYTLSNRDALRRSIQDVLAWEFDRVIPGHGSIVESGGKQAVLDGYDWLL